jgi:hypothetical protein
MFHSTILNGIYCNVRIFHAVSNTVWVMLKVFATIHHAAVICRIYILPGDLNTRKGLGLAVRYIEIHFSIETREYLA